MVLKSEVIEALVALGYSAEQARRAVSRISVSVDMDQSAILKQALKGLSC